ncbi:glycosyltransferase family 4 protein [Haloterrigena sp. SYSU A558-1]|uniref:Glycosyltransferase family 4 protein n=1 Tax=Haloterrigena gelatinilytica TaxID=2741724 RepID=A0ABX2L944_9EURY|nr:glycosyltransferase family 4 protein [Haloterrigena gelatinilytica]NUC70863.1 glycosyltransferase family 4 protein [Haloterrigena gelatinilytica]
MRVLMAPFFEGNQYLELLSSSLEQKGVEVKRSTTARPLALPLLDVLRTDADVFHLHWTHVYFLFGSYERFYRIPLVKYACWAFSLFFLVQLYLINLFCDRMVWTVHNKCNHERRYEEMDRWVGQQVFSLVDAVQVWDDNTKRELAEYLDVSTTKMVAIPHGNYHPFYPPDEQLSKRKARSSLGLPQNKRIFLYFGMIRPYKQVPKLLNVWSDLDPEGAHLIVAGKPKHEDLIPLIRSVAADRDDVTENLQYISDDEVQTYFAACDLTVFPYKHIYSSGSAVLAMSMGRPFVAPAQGAIPSLGSDKNIVYEDDSLKSAIEKALQVDSDTLCLIGRQNIRRADHTHSWDKIGDAVFSLYRR